MSEEPLAAETRQRSPRVEQDGREVLLVELGASRERGDWLIAHNEQLKREVAQANAEAQEYAAMVGRSAGKVIAWRMTAIICIGVAAVQWLLRWGGV